MHVIQLFSFVFLLCTIIIAIVYVASSPTQHPNNPFPENELSESIGVYKKETQ